MGQSATAGYGRANPVMRLRLSCPFKSTGGPIVGSGHCRRRRTCDRLRAQRERHWRTAIAPRGLSHPTAS